MSTPADQVPASGFKAGIESGLEEAHHESNEFVALLGVPFTNLLDLAENGTVGEHTDKLLGFADEQGRKADEIAAQSRTTGNEIGHAVGSFVGHAAIGLFSGGTVLAGEEMNDQAAQAIRSGDTPVQAMETGALGAGAVLAGMKVGTTGSLAARTAAGVGFGAAAPVVQSEAEHLIDKRQPALPSLAGELSSIGLFALPGALKGAQKGVQAVLRNVHLRVPDTPPTSEPDELIEYHRGYARGYQGAKDIFEHPGTPATQADIGAENENAARGRFDGVNDAIADSKGAPRLAARGPIFSEETVKAAAKGAVPGLRARIADSIDAVGKWAHSVAPIARGEREELAHAVVNKIGAELEVAQAHAEDILKPFAAHFERQDDETNIAQMYRASQGDHFDDAKPEIKEFFARARAILPQRWLIENSLGYGTEYLRNYFPQSFKKPEQAEALVGDATPGQRKPRFTKHRFFQNIYEAVKFRYPDQSRLTLKTSNPAKLVLGRVLDSLRIEYQAKLMREMQEFGLARSVMAEDYEPLPGEPKQIRAPTSESTKPAIGEAWLMDAHGNKVKIDNRNWIVPERLIAPVKNGMFQGSIWTSNDAASKAFRVMMSSKIAIVPLSVSLSAFHLMHLGLVMRQVSAAAEAIHAIPEEQITAASVGHVASAMAQQLALIGEAGWGRDDLSLTRIMAMMRGKDPEKFFTLWKHQKIAPTRNDAVMVQALMESGYHAPNPVEYRGNAIGYVKDAARSGHYAKGLAALPFAALRSIQYPIMDMAVPYMKLQAMVEGITHTLTERPELALDANRAERIRTFARIRQNIDQRFGELPYNTLLWKNWLRATMQLSFLSFTWQYGLVSQFGGGALDLARVLSRGLPVEHSQKAISSKLLFALMYPVAGAAVGYLYNELIGGHRPETVKDLVYPVIGHYANGDPMRVNTTSFLRDAGGIYYKYQSDGLMGIVSYGTDKIDPMIGDFVDMYHNQNFLNQQLIDPQASLGTEAQQAAKAFYHMVEPMSLTNFMQVDQQGLSPDQVDLANKAKWMGLMGSTVAPQYVSEPRAVQMIYMLSAENGTEIHSASGAEQAQARKRLVNMYFHGTRGQFLEDAMLAYVTKYNVSVKQVEALEREFAEPQAYSTFEQLTPQQQTVVLEHMPEDVWMKYILAAHPTVRAAWMQAHPR